ncbi:protein of unknown function [Nitratireductor aquimarinus]
MRPPDVEFDRKSGNSGKSRNDVRDDVVFQFLKPVLERQLFLFHALNAKRVAARSDHCVDRGVEIRVILFEAGEFETNFRLFLF